MGTRGFLDLIPKIDLHCHLEGSLGPEVLGTLARRHGLKAPSLSFDGFGGFLRAFGAVCDLLRDEDDFRLAAQALLDRARALNVVHLEILFSPQVFLRRGVSMGSILRGLDSARRSSRRRGPSVVFILDGVRQWGGDWLLEVVRDLPASAAGGLVAGIGIGGMEPSLAPSEFLAAVGLARERGLRVTVHAGEHGGPGHIRKVLDVLRPDRIGHGVTAARDRGLLERLARERVPLEVCIGSNLATGAVDGIEAHPLRRLIDAGLAVTLNSDDGAFFRTDIRRELGRAMREFGLEPADLHRVTRDAARGSFLPPVRRSRLIGRIDREFGRLRSSPRLSGRS